MGNTENPLHTTPEQVILPLSSILSPQWNENMGYETKVINEMAYSVVLRVIFSSLSFLLERLRFFVCLLSFSE